MPLSCRLSCMNAAFMQYRAVLPGRCRGSCPDRSRRWEHRQANQALAGQVRWPRVGVWQLRRRRSTRSTCSTSPTARSTWPTHAGRLARSPGTEGGCWRLAGFRRARPATSLRGRYSSWSNGNLGRPSRATVRIPRWTTCTRTANGAPRRTYGTCSTVSTTSGRSFDRDDEQTRSSPGHVDLALEGDVAGPGEGRRHWYVADVGGGPDSRYVPSCEQARTRGQQVVNVAMATMCRYHSEVRDDRVVTVMRGD